MGAGRVRREVWTGAEKRTIIGAGRRRSATAALGLSEQSDALVIAVSEERGVVSVAERGVLREVSSPAALKARLDRFMRARFPARKEAFWKQFVARRWHFQVVAVALAMIGWALQVV